MKTAFFGQGRLQCQRRGGRTAGNHPSLLGAAGRRRILNLSRGEVSRCLTSFSVVLVRQKGKLNVEAFWEFITGWTFLIIMAVLLVALIGLLLFLRSRRTDD